MPVQDTSVEAYHDLDDLGERQAQVFGVIRDSGPISNLQIGEELGLPVNQITGRTNELVKLGRVREAHKDVSPITGRRVIFWAAA
jgi:predicted ArsR family transcriptional regulator